MSNKCLVTRLKAIVNDDSLPVVETMQQFTLDAIAAGGNKSVTDAQKWALNHFFYQIGAINNSGIWNKIVFATIPIIAADYEHHMIDHKNGVLVASLGSSFIDSNGGLETTAPSVTRIFKNISLEHISSSNVAGFVSTVKDRTIDATKGLQTKFNFADNTSLSMALPNVGSGRISARQLCGSDAMIRVGEDYYNGAIRSILLNINGIPSENTFKAVFSDINGNKLGTQPISISGNFIETGEKVINSAEFQIGAGNVFGVYILFNEALTEAECSKLIQANQELVEAF